MMNKVKKKLVNDDGYLILEKVIPENVIDKILSKKEQLYPVRASSANKKYAEKDEIRKLTDISVWWSQMLLNWPEIIEVNTIIEPYILEILPESSWYASDVVTIKSHSKWISAHIDTPHRFSKYNYDKKLLGIQSIVALSDIDKDSGSTGLVPKSQLIDFNINLCYKGYFDEWFKKNCIQPTLKKGSVLMYNCRLMHSSMPNPTNFDRPALLMNYLDRSVIDEVKSLDNVWQSNS